MTEAVAGEDKVSSAQTKHFIGSIARNPRMTSPSQSFHPHQAASVKHALTAASWKDASALARLDELPLLIDLPCSRQMISKGRELVLDSRDVMVQTKLTRHGARL